MPIEIHQGTHIVDQPYAKVSNLDISSHPRPLMGDSIDHELVDLDRAEKNVELENPTSTRPHRPIRKKDFGIIPIPKNRRHDPKLKPEDQFAFTWRMNIVFALAAVSVSGSTFSPVRSPKTSPRFALRVC